MAPGGRAGSSIAGDKKRGGSKSRLFATVTRLFYWQGYVLPSSSLTVVPGRQTMPFCFA
jgi:hypothetical protein